MNDIHPAAAAINADLENESPAIFAALSPLGHRAFFPQDIPFQAGEAKGTEYNGTIGVFTDGHGNAVPLPSMEAALNLPLQDRNRAFLYSPVQGIDEVRQAWRAWQRRGQPEALPSTLPLVVNGLTHGLSIIADLFGGEGRHLAVAEPYWGNYRQAFALRTGARVVSAPAFRGGRFNPAFAAEALAELPIGEPAIVMLNFPSNPSGYSPTAPERQTLRDSLLALAEDRPLVALCDDAYAGVVFSDDAPSGSLFWELIEAHPNLIPVKADGATKEFALFGGRVGFLTFGVAAGSATAAALESKVKSMVRGTVGSPVATSQVLLLQALRSGNALREIAELREIARQRFDILQEAVRGVDRSLLRPMPFNSGYFVLLELPEELGLDANEVRRYLIERHSTGVVSVQSRYLRIALCSVAAEAIPEMVARVEQGVREMAEAGRAAAPVG